MPRLEDNPEYKYAAELAKVGPETWESWKRAGQTVLDIIRGLQPQQQVHTIEDYQQLSPAERDQWLTEVALAPEAGL